MSQFSCTKIADSFGLAYMDKQSQNDSKIVEHYPAKTKTLELIRLQD
jgi:hypothetical protein